ncbi:MAG: plastocyanin/azurin family copper-binding protein [Candidatus Nitrosotalea sp.]|nr:plastocyanin/azurin family copper-binding protein [Candidatus Nitrosotalea sp.]
MKNVAALTAVGVFLTLATLLAYSQPVHDHVALAQEQSSDANSNQPLSNTSDGVIVSLIAPPTVYANDLTTIQMKVVDEKSGAPLTHVDWAIVVRDPIGNLVYKTTTAHSHAGMMDFKYAFWMAGKNTISLTASSIGPKMMGMDVPAMAQTRTLVSGDPMMGWKKDPVSDFGSRTYEFPVYVLAEKQTRTISGSEPGTSINVEMDTNSPQVVAGKPVTLVFTVTNGKDNSMVTHPDMQLTFKQGTSIISRSSDKGGMMAMSGAYHGHTGVMTATLIFPTTGHYFVDADLSSLPVSNLMFGTASTRFDVHVVAPTGVSTENISGSEPAPNTVNVLGIEAPFFAPNSINVKAGTTIYFVNTDGNIHTVTSVKAGTQDPDGTFDSNMIKPGQTFTYKFDKPGTYNYICTIHPHMHGTINVS